MLSSEWFIENYCKIRDKITGQEKSIKLNNVQKTLLKNIDNHNETQKILLKVLNKMCCHVEQYYNAKFCFEYWDCIFHGEHDYETYDLKFKIIFDEQTGSFCLEKKWKFHGEIQTIRLTKSYESCINYYNSILEDMLKQDIIQIYKQSTGYSDNFFDYYTLK